MDYKSQTHNLSEILAKTYNFDGIIFEPYMDRDGPRLRTKQPETTTIEFKGFGKLMHWNDKTKLYQPNEITEQIVAFMNTSGGKIYFGIADNNHALLGGDYTPKEKDMLSIFLKNLVKKLGISGMGLIEDPLFIEYPKHFWIPTAIDNNASRYLVVIKINKSPILVKLNGLILIRELGGVSQISEDAWRMRNSIIRQPIQRMRSTISYAQVLKTT